MPRTKTTRNPFGSILPKKIVREGKKVTVYDARKRYRDMDGNRQEKFKRCRSMTEANTALVNFQNEITRELSEAKERKEKNIEHTFFELTDYFRKTYLIEAKIIKGLIVEGLRGGLPELRRQVKDFEDYFGDVPLPEISYEKIRQMKIHISTSPQKHDYTDEPPKPATVNRKLSLLGRILKVGVQLGWLSINPMKAGKSLIKKKDEVSRNRMLTFEEERRLLAACSGADVIKTTRAGIPFEMKLEQNPRAHLKLILVMALDTAMRQGEIFAVERGQIDLKKLTITLRREQTKSWRARTIPVTARLEKLLREYLEANPGREDEKLFGGAKNCRRAFHSALSRARIENFRFHDLRHTAISWFDHAELTEGVKKNIAGHSTGDVHELYNNLSDDVLAKTREKLNRSRREIDSSFEKKEALAA